jgi:hypothetical protein
LGETACKAVTCNSDGGCTVRGSSTLSLSSSSETTHIPTNCYEGKGILYCVCAYMYLRYIKGYDFALSFRAPFSLCRSLSVLLPSLTFRFLSVRTSFDDNL